MAQATRGRPASREALDALYEADKLYLNGVVPRSGNAKKLGRQIASELGLIKPKPKAKVTAKAETKANTEARAKRSPEALEKFMVESKAEANVMANANSRAEALARVAARSRVKAPKPDKGKEQA